MTMMTGSKLFLFLTLLVGTLTQVPYAQARPSELHVRVGQFWAKYTGPIENEVSVSGALDVDYSLFISNDSAVTFRSTSVIEFPDVKNYYSFSGAGMRFFTKGPAFPINGEEQGFSFESSAPWRTYFGFELGLAQATVVSYGRVLQTNSSLLVFNANTGATYALNPQMGISGQLNVALGSGYSSVAVLSTSVMGLVGLCFFF